jgi:hypothetical protein
MPVFDLSSDLNPPPQVEDPERFYRSGENSLFYVAVKLAGAQTTLLFPSYKLAAHYCDARRVLKGISKPP